MSSSRILITLAVVALCCLTFANSLKCFTCVNSKDCKKPKRLDCNFTLAIQTRDYLNLYYTGVPNTTSNGFECMGDLLRTSSNEMTHKGCIFNHFQSCSYTVRPYFAQSHDRSCRQCNKDGCNPADRVSSSLLIVVFTLIVTKLMKYA